MKQQSLLRSFEYDVIRSRRKTLSIVVKEGQVQVRAPLRAPMYWIREFVEEKSRWIQRQVLEQRQKLNERLVINQGRKITFLGKSRSIQVIRSKQSRVEIDQFYLYLYAPDRNPLKLEKLFYQWLQRQAKEYMSTRTIKTARQLGLEKRLGNIMFRKTKTKWGHCCHDGTIQYNWLAMMAPKEVVDYLIAHETSHLKYMDHSERFWRTVESVCPDYLELRDWLRDNGHRFWTEERPKNRVC